MAMCEGDVSAGLEERIARIEAIEAIRQLIGLYALAGDRKNDRVMFSGMFTDDAMWSCEGFGRFEGKPAILEALSDIAASRILWSLHFPASPLITIDDGLESASVFWWLWELSTMRDETGDQSSFMGGTYEAACVRVGNRWMFRKVVLSLQTITPFRDGWTMVK